jgi:uncharacterized Zn finger protein (UPF0148 family)
VLGAKMLQGYTLKEQQCDKCSMPLMEYKGGIDCVVCPALAKKAKKKMKEQQRLSAEKDRLEKEILASREAKAHLEQSALAARRAAEEEQARYEEHTRRQQKDEKERVLASERDMSQEQARIRKQQEEEKARILVLEAEEARLLAEARASGRFQSEAARVKEEARVMEQFRLENEAKLVDERRAAAEQRRREELQLMEETKRLERMTDQIHNSSVTDAMRQEWFKQEERKRMGEDIKKSEDVKVMEALRRREDLESKLLDEGKRAEREARMIECLENEAMEKQTMAEAAITRAKAALETVSHARKGIIAQTIQQAEAEAIQEAEEFIRAVREDYKDPVILPTSSDLKRERWETLRSEGRSIMTRRIMGGWTVLAEFCPGMECADSPLLTNGKQKECVVCGGCGNGKDGVYMMKPDEAVYMMKPDEAGEDIELKLSQVNGISEHAIQVELTPIGEMIEAHATSPTANRTVQELQDEFDIKRNMVSKEIGKRMIQGWNLLDMSCPHCVMPLMSDSNGNGEICVLCPMLEKVTVANDARSSNVSTIATVETSKPSLVRFKQAADPIDESVEESMLALPKNDTAHSGSNAARDGSQQHLVPMGVSNGSYAVDVDESCSRENVEVVVEAVSMDNVNGDTELLVHESKPEPELHEIIREQANRRELTSPRALTSPMGDPPASLRATPTSRDGRRRATDPEDGEEQSRSRFLFNGSQEDKMKKVNREEDDDMTISLPKNFDFNDEEAIKRLMALAKERNAATKTMDNALANGTAMIEAHEADDVSRMTGPVKENNHDSDAVETTKKESLAKLFCSSPEGRTAIQLLDVGNVDSVQDLAERFVNTHYAHFSSAESIDVSAQKDLATDLVVELASNGAKYRVEANYFEDVQKPQYEVAENDDSMSKTSSRRPRVTPESMGSARRASKKNLPPRSEANDVNRSSLPPKHNSSPRHKAMVSPTNKRNSSRQSPRNEFVFIGGPSADKDMDDRSVESEFSRAETVASQTIDSLLTRIEDAQMSLLAPGSSAKQQAESAQLIEKLATAAIAMRKLEELK